MGESDFEMSDGEYKLPDGFDFEFVDTTARDTNTRNASDVIENEAIRLYDNRKNSKEDDVIVKDHTEQLSQKSNDEFFFPLFAGEDKGTADMNNLMKVSLKDNPESDAIVQSRPDDYYFAKYTNEDIEKMKQSAIEYVDIFKSFDNRFKNKPCLDATQYNISLEKDKKRNRRSLKNRINKARGQRNIKERKNKAEMLEKQQIKFVNQKKKRGGKKNKKKAASAEKTFRTE